MRKRLKFVHLKYPINIATVIYLEEHELWSDFEYCMIIWYNYYKN